MPALIRRCSSRTSRIDRARAYGLIELNDRCRSVPMLMGKVHCKQDNIDRSIAERSGALLQLTFDRSMCRR